MSVSIIIPAYNEELRLPTLLCSLRQATTRLHDLLPKYSVEVIVVDNCSTDNTASLALEYRAKVITENRRSVACVRNKGASHATGNYLIFIDADYRVSSKFLIGIVKALESDPRTVALGVKVLVEPDEIDIIQGSFANFILFLLRRIRHMGFGVFVFRKNYFEQLGGFDEGVFAYEDVELHEKLRRDLYKKKERYRVLHHALAYASARGFHRGGMFISYFTMLLSKKARRDPAQCRYWYGRES